MIKGEKEVIAFTILENGKKYQCILYFNMSKHKIVKSKP